METPTPEKRAIVPGDRVTFSLAGKTHKGTATSVYVAVNRKRYVTISAPRLRRAEYRRLLGNVERARRVYIPPPIATEPDDDVDIRHEAQDAYAQDLWGPEEGD